PDLAATLQRIAAEGPDGFYRGPIAAALTNASHTHGGLISESDLAEYHTGELPPLRCTYRGYAIISSPPPSSGGTTLCETLGVLSGWDISAAGPQSPRAVHLTV